MSNAPDSPSPARPQVSGLRYRIVAVLVVAILGVVAATGIVCVSRRARTSAVIARSSVIVPGDIGELRISRDFGTTALAVKNVHVPPSATAMSLLAANAKVQTAYGGGFVNSIDGLASGYTGGAGVRTDWFYFVNGIEADRGAADYALHGADREWWDYHRWDFTPTVPAVVGQFPQPFESGAGSTLSTIVLYGGGFDAQARAIVSDLARAGVMHASAAPLEQNGTLSARRHAILVGTWQQVSAIRAIAEDIAHPASSGLFAGFESRQLVTLDSEGGRVATDAPAGLVLATANAEKPDAAIWLVTGGEPQDVRAAAALLSAGAPELQGRFGVVVLRNGSTIALPTRPIH